MAASLREVFTPLIAYMLFFARTPAEQQRPFTDVRATVEHLLDQQRQAVKRNDIAPQDYESASFAVIAWTDEMVMRHAHGSNGALFDEWRHAPLQVALFNTANAGEEFFERLARINPAQKQIHELYYLALCLGFRGRYYDDAQEPQLIELRHQCAAHLPIAVTDLFDLEKRQERITPEPYEVRPPARKAQKRGRPSAYWLALPAAAIAAALVYFLWPSGPNAGDIENALRGFQCAHVNLAGIDHGVVKLAGHVDSEEQGGQVRRKIEDLRGVKGVDADFSVIARPFCEVMDVLGPVRAAGRKNGFDLNIRPSKGCDAAYYRGENLVVDITAKQPLHYVYVDYYVADRQSVAHLFPNPQQPDNALGNAAELTVGGVNNKAQWQIQPPFGQEMVTVISSPKPLFTPARLMPETADSYVSSLRGALSTDGLNADVAANYCFTVSADR